MMNDYDVCGDVTFLYATFKGIERCIAIDTKRLPELINFNKKWRIEDKGQTNCYAITSIYKPKQDDKKGTYLTLYLHTLLLPKTEGTVIDHINGNGLDNRSENLRVVSPHGNMQNRKGATKASKSGVRNVSWNEKRKKWYIYMTVDGKNRNFGGYEDLKEAELVARNLRIEYFGKA